MSIRSLICGVRETWMSDDEPDESCSELSLLTSWDNDFLSFNHSDLVDRSIRIFECFGFHNGDRLGIPR